MGLLPLMRVVAPHSFGAERLYLRSDQPLDYDRQARTISIAAGQTVDFDGWFNSLFESHFAGLCSARRVWLKLRIAGQVALRVYRTSLHAGETTLERRRIGSSDGQPVEALVKIDLEELEPLRGRIAFELTGLAGTSRLLDGAWCVEAEERRREVRLDVVICTFHREAEVRRTVAALSGASEVAPWLNRIIVVDNGQTLSPAEFVDERVRLYSQPNFGGTGGFTRGVIESLEDDRSTHLVLMDDDVDVDVEAVARIARTLAVMDGDHAISGGMFDLLRPTLLWEAGSRRMREPFAVASQYHRLDLAEKDALDELTRVRASEYGAWWLFAVSKRAARAVGLALPCFIHADDIEYGVRLREHGVRNFPMPGIGVWHHPFYAKPAEWMTYYDYRNQLICDAGHSIWQSGAVAQRFATDTARALLRYDYRAAALMVKALEDFAAGPDAALGDPIGKHDEVTDLSRKLAPRATATRLEPTAKMASLPISLRKRAKVRRLLTLNGHLVPWARPRSLLRYAVHPYATGYPRMCETWRARLPELTSMTYWRRYLGLDAAAAAAPAEARASSA